MQVKFGGRWIATFGPLLALAAIVLTSAGLSLVWVFRVPIYQSPDEPQHLDYALGLLEHQGLFRAQPAEPGVFPNYNVHPYTFYLIDRSDWEFVRSNPAARMAPEYGMAAYFAALDRQAPPRESIRITRPPSLTGTYPFGYYALLALWMGLLRQFSDRLTVLFFGARIFSVLLLVCTLLLSYATARELRLRRGTSLVLTTILGLLPLTSFISSYVQPDNLGLTLATLCFYLSLRARRCGSDPRVLAALGAGLGGLLITKPHFYVCVLVPILSMLAIEEVRLPPDRRRWRTKAILVLLPSFLLGLVHWWVTSTARNFYSYPNNRTDALIWVLEGFQAAIREYFTGQTHRTFWGHFGWLCTPLVMGGRRTDALVWFLIQSATWVILVLTLFRIEQVGSRLIRLAARGRRMLAVRMIFSNPAINSYFAFSLFMFAFYVYNGNNFFPQGRNWLPFLLPVVLTATIYAPRALTLVMVRRGFSALVLGGLLAFSLVGSYRAVVTIEKRFYLEATHGKERFAACRVRGLYEFQRGDFARAIACWDEALRVAPRAAEIYKHRGVARMSTRRFDLAKSDFTRAIELEPGFADAYYQRGIASSVEKDLDHARADFSAAIQLDPRNATYFLQRAQVLAAQGNEAEARRDRARAIELEPALGRAAVPESQLTRRPGAAEERTR